MIETDQRFTPQSVLDVVREFDRIALDPCTVPDNPVGADRFYTEEDDGLVLRWKGLSFVNPPYSRGKLLKWAKRACDMWGYLSVESISLVPADTSTRATQFYLETANAVAFWNKRMRFTGDAGARFANAFFYYGERQPLQARVLAARHRAGAAMTPPKPRRDPSRICAHCGRDDGTEGPRPLGSELRWVGEAMAYACSYECARKLGWP